MMPDYFISWGPIMTEEMTTLYHFPPERIFECGVPHFDVYAQPEHFMPREAVLRRLGLAPSPAVRALRHGGAVLRSPRTRRYRLARRRKSARNPLPGPAHW